MAKMLNGRAGKSQHFPCTAQWYPSGNRVTILCVLPAQVLKLYNVGRKRKEVHKMDQSERRQYLIKALLDENKEYRDMDIPASAAGQAQLLRGLMNIRAPHAADPAFIKIQDVYLKQRAEEKGIIASDDLQPASA